jgi:hypothetical protein
MAPAGQQVPHRRKKDLGHLPFADITARPGGKGLFDGVSVLAQGIYQHPDTERSQSWNQVEPALLTKGKIQESQIGAGCADSLKDFASAACLATDNVRLLREQLPQSLPHRGMIIDQEYTGHVFFPVRLPGLSRSGHAMIRHDPSVKSLASAFFVIPAEAESKCFSGRSQTTAFAGVGYF